MPLSVMTYSGLMLAPDIKPGKKGDLPEGYWQAHTKATEEYWPGRSAPFVDGAVYKISQKGGFVAAETARAYDDWRDWLARIGGWNSAHDAWVASEGPFWEHIKFGDGRGMGVPAGVIGPMVAMKLAGDYETHAAKVKATIGTADDIGDYILQYNNWRHAFQMAANLGAVEF